MAINPIAYTERVVGDFLRYQLSTYPATDLDLYAQMRDLLSLERTRDTPLLKGPYIKRPAGVGVHQGKGLRDGRQDTGAVPADASKARGGQVQICCKNGN